MKICPTKGIGCMMMYVASHSITLGICSKTPGCCYKKKMREKYFSGGQNVPEVIRRNICFYFIYAGLLISEKVLKYSLNQIVHTLSF